MGAWPGQWLVCLTEFLIFYEAVRSSDMYLKHTRKSPVGVEAPRWKPKARTCARVHPRLQLPPCHLGDPGSTLPSPFWAHSSPKGPLGPEASQTDEMSRTAGQTRNSSPFKHWHCFLSLPLLGSPRALRTTAAGSRGHLQGRT